jgi:hypothetical protein
LSVSKDKILSTGILALITSPFLKSISLVFLELSVLKIKVKNKPKKRIKNSR